MTITPTDEVRTAIQNALNQCSRGNFTPLFFKVDEYCQEDRHEYEKASILEECEKQIENFVKKYPILNYELSKIRWFKSSALSKEADEEHRNSWLRTCLNTRKDPDVEFYLDLRGIDREQEIRQCIVKKGSWGKKDSKLKSEDIEEIFINQPGRIYLKVIADWYLKRYNLRMAKKLFTVVAADEFPSFKFLYPVSYPILIPILILILSALLYPFKTPPYIGHYQQLFLPFLPGESVSNYCPAVKLIYPSWLGIITFLIYLLGLTGGFLFFRSKNNMLLAHLALPRLIGAIVIGFLPLVLTQEIWDLCKRLSIIHAVIIFLLILSISFTYLYIEVKNQKIGSNRQAMFRASLILLFGLTVSLIISMIINDLVAQYFLDVPVKHETAQCPEDHKITLMAGVCGIMHPQVAILFAASALLIGIFIQVFWEEKTITEPL